MLSESKDGRDNECKNMNVDKLIQEYFSNDVQPPIIEVFDDDNIVNVLKRPFVDEFLKEMAELFEIIVFTASIAEYASPLLDQLDKNHYFSRRLYR